MNTRRKSTLFLVEQLIVIAVFALCAVACISILTTSYFMVNDSRDTANALIAAQNYAEAFKATGGDIEATARVFGNIGSHEAGDDGASFSYSVSCDKDWMQRAITADSAEFILTLSGRVYRNVDGPDIVIGEISVDRASGENLVSFPVAARR